MDNRRKIHIASGENNNIVNVTAKQALRQPAYNTTKKYLTVAEDEQDFKSAIPVRSRTVEGWLNDVETDTTFTLDNTTTDNHYILTGRGNSIYLKTKPDFNLVREVKAGGALDNSKDHILLSLTKTLDGDIKNKPTDTDHIEINGNYFLRSQNIWTTNIKSNLGSSLLTLNDTQLVLEQNTMLTSGKSLTSPSNTSLGGTTTITGNTTITGGKVSVSGDTITLNGTNTIDDITNINGNLNLNAETILAGNIHNADSSLSIKPGDASITVKTLSITTKGIINELYAAGSDSNAALHVTSTAVDIKKPTTIGELTVSKITIVL